MKSSKKTGFIGVEALLRLIIGIALAAAVILSAKSCFRLSDEGLSSFNQLASKIEQLKDGELDSLALRMDKTTAILGFTSSSTRISYDVTRPQTDANFYFDRPIQCTASKACICLCQKPSFPSSTVHIRQGHNFIEGHFACDSKDIVCKTFEQIDFTDKMTKNTFGEPDDPATDYVFTDGFMFGRKVYINIPVFETRIKTIYMERYGNLVGVCFEPPCLTPEQKQGST